VASDGGSGVLILMGRQWAPAKEVRPTEQGSACFEDFHDSAGACFAVPSFHLTMRFDEPVPTKHAATDSEERSAPKPAEKAALVSSG
jgi:hypothetical protein